ncbi:ABC-type transport system involved in multi-copper enzyme maturation, permease component [Saccharopolyspora antimicrobica]|uniref:ABC-type transport system involved in multi-copper enzyme maturation permease subunit n=1 Tax=Saccharopolyspora antimicrobica TaxID=455193 RepID=A0A1I4VIG5_9PSEU|nr:ABC transporter permease [Saccharopolyspora antimicrobica]RKT86326.1 ABC-type transport system involved in multi-copper enzyme maturation permease subunit [Saccharopolyspora antimicrobica]SFN00961.1 ABC-type transport system involved in multi-copper enzyme maturation, permease component [Saccharopolyspora antimicrobica]
MTLSGIKIVAAQEFRVRLRTGRWRWLLIAWVAVIAAFTGLLRYGLGVARATSDVGMDNIGLPMFGSLMLFVLGLALLVSPALAAQSINGDRERGTLATVQVTPLTAWEITLGKFAASWITGLVFLVLTLPFAAWAVLEGGVGPLRALAVLAVVALLMGVICAMAQGLSALFARGITSTLMSYVLVFALTIGTVIVFFLSLPLTMKEKHYTYEGGTYTSDVPQPHLVWWLMAPNPFVILGDAAPAPPMQYNPYTGKDEPVVEGDPLSGIGVMARHMRSDVETYRSDALTSSPAVWPYGLGFNVLVGGGALWLSARRLRTPVRKLSRGVRIA